MALGPHSSKRIQHAEARLDDAILANPDNREFQINVDLEQKEVDVLKSMYVRAGWSVEVRRVSMGPNEEGFSITLQRGATR